MSPIDLRPTGTSSEAACERALAAIADVAPLNAVLTVTDARARAAAAAIDALPDAERARLPLAGVPIAIKDNICARGTRTTAGSRMLDRFVAPYDATVVQRLDAAGAVIAGIEKGVAQVLARVGVLVEDRLLRAGDDDGAF